MKQTSIGIKKMYGITTETHFTFLTILAISLITILTATNSLALEITEFESNPSGADSGSEWIELHSSQEVDLSDYILENGDGDTLELSDRFTDYFVIELEKQWLDNSKEKIIIKLNGEKIDETPELSDSKNSELSLSKCNDSWSLEEPTKNGENDCKEDDEEEEAKEQEDQEQAPGSEPYSNTKTENEIRSLIQTDTQNTLKEISQEKITLSANSQNNQDEPEKITFISKEAKIRLWMLYGFTALCITIIIALAWNKL
jgi:hypothetical protein